MKKRLPSFLLVYLPGEVERLGERRSLLAWVMVVVDGGCGAKRTEEWVRDLEADIGRWRYLHVEEVCLLCLQIQQRGGSRHWAARWSRARQLKHRLAVCGLGRRVLLYAVEGSEEEDGVVGER